MIREQKFVFLAVLTLLAYGLGLFFEVHFFILPFPIFDFVLLWGVLRFIGMNTSSREIYSYLFLLAVLFKIIMNPILLAFVFSQNQLTDLNASFIPKLFLSLSLLLLIISFITWKVREKLTIHLSWYVLHALFGFLTLTFDARLEFFVGLIPALLLYRRNKENSFRHIWNLYFILELMTAVMLYFVVS